MAGNLLVGQKKETVLRIFMYYNFLKNESFDLLYVCLLTLQLQQHNVEPDDLIHLILN